MTVTTSKGERIKVCNGCMRNNPDLNDDQLAARFGWKASDRYAAGHYAGHYCGKCWKAAGFIRKGEFHVGACGSECDS